MSSLKISNSMVMYSNKSKLGETQPKNSKNGYKNGEFGAGETA